MAVRVGGPPVGVHEPHHTRSFPVGRSDRVLGADLGRGVDQAQRHSAPMAGHGRGTDVLRRMNRIRHERNRPRQPVAGEQGRREDSSQSAEGGDHECSIEGIFNITHRGLGRSKTIRARREPVPPRIVVLRIHRPPTRPAFAPTS